MVIICVENFESKNLSQKIKFWVKTTLDDGRVGGWVGGWMEGSQSRVKDCLQQSKILKIHGREKRWLDSNTEETAEYREVEQENWFIHDLVVLCCICW